jgi:hypothetical protein
MKSKETVNLMGVFRLSKSGPTRLLFFPDGCRRGREMFCCLTGPLPPFDVRVQIEATVELLVDMFNILRIKTWTVLSPVGTEQNGRQEPSG